MTKELKKCYYYLDLPFNVDIDKVKAQEKVFIKILRAKALKKGVSQKKKIDKVVDCANKIISNIEKNGIPTDKETNLHATGAELATQVFILLAVSIVAIISYLSLIKF